MNKIQRLTNEVIDYAKLIIVSAIMIVVVYLVIKSLAGTVPATIASILIGLGLVFIYGTNDKIRHSINEWVKKK
jgi:hypothetical protein